MLTRVPIAAPIQRHNKLSLVKSLDKNRVLEEFCAISPVGRQRSFGRRLRIAAMADFNKSTVLVTGAGGRTGNVASPPPL